jgi:lysyl-tRNA synthetase class II
MAKDEYLDMAEDMMEQAAQELNETGEVLSAGARIEAAQVYALVSIARALHELVAQDRASALRAM